MNIYIYIHIHIYIYIKPISNYIVCVGVNDGEEFANILVILLQVYWTCSWWVIWLTEQLHSLGSARIPGWFSWRLVLKFWPSEPALPGHVPAGQSLCRWSLQHSGFWGRPPSDLPSKPLCFGCWLVAAPGPVGPWEEQTAGNSSAYQLLQVELSPGFVQSPWKVEVHAWPLLFSWRAKMKAHIFANIFSLQNSIVWSACLFTTFFFLFSLNSRLFLSRKLKLFCLLNYGGNLLSTLTKDYILTSVNI